MKDKSNKIITAYSSLLEYIKLKNIFFPQVYINKITSNKKSNLCHSTVIFSLAIYVGILAVKTEIALAVSFSNIKAELESERTIKIPSIKNSNKKIVPKSSTGINSKTKIIDYKPVNSFRDINEIVFNKSFEANNNLITKNSVTSFKYIAKIIQPKTSENIGNIYTHKNISEITLIKDVKSAFSQSPIGMNEENYKVLPGDTLNSIASHYGISASELINANHITNANFIKVNQTLVIPKQISINGNKKNQLSRSLVKNNELQTTGSGVSEHKRSYKDLNKNTHQKKLHKNIQPFNIQKSKLISTVPSYVDVYNNTFQIPLETDINPSLPKVSNPDKYLPSVPAKYTGHIWPSKGVVTSGFGRRWGRMHKGIDIAAPTGTPIMASASGEVISAGWSSGGYGNLLRIRHPDGSISLYAHNSRILVRRGQKVNQGQKIAEMGSTGYSTGPHLHYEIHLRGRGAQNPMAFLPKTR